MVINYSHHLLILLFLVHFANCNWLRLGITGVQLPEQEYIEQFDPLNQQTIQIQKMHSIDNSTHRINHKLANNSIVKYSKENVFLNHFDHHNDYDSLLGQLDAFQLRFIKKNPNSLKVIGSGTNIAIEQCALRFEKERWQCSIEDEKEVFGQTLKRANRETGFLQAIVSAGVTYSLTKACSTGSLANCACDYRYERYSVIGSSLMANPNRQKFSWSGCSDNLAYGIKLATQFLDSSSNDMITKRRAPSLRESMSLHNSKAGREAIKKLMRLKCRCHGSCGSCQLKTCWKVLPNFDEIGKYLKTKYQQAVQIEGIVNQGKTFKFKRSRRSTSDQQSASGLRGSKDGYKSTNQMSGHTTHRGRILSAHFFSESEPEIELQSNSLVINNLHRKSTTSEEEMDEDSDYDDEDEEFVENVVEKRKLESRAIEKTNKITSKSKQVNNKPVDSSENETDSHKVSKSSNSSHNADDRAVGKATRSMNRQSKSNLQKKANKKQTNNQQVNKHGIVANKQIDEINLQFTKVITDHRPTANRINPIISRPRSGQSINSQSASEISKDSPIKIQSSQTNGQRKSLTNYRPINQRSPDKLDLVFIHKSPNYCSANDNLKILGTANRTCRKVKKRKFDSCDSLCCGRGYDKRIVRKTENCHCEFDVGSVQVKCKACEQTNEIYTCK